MCNYLTSLPRYGNNRDTIEEELSEKWNFKDEKNKFKEYVDRVIEIAEIAEKEKREKLMSSFNIFKCDGGLDIAIFGAVLKSKDIMFSRIKLKTILLNN